MRLLRELLLIFQTVGLTFLMLGAPLALVLGQRRFGADVADAVLPLAGVVLGALLGVVVQAFFSEQQERNRRLAVGHAVFFKVAGYASDAQQVCTHVNKYRPADPAAITWRTLPSFITPEVPPASFTPDELGLFLAAGEGAFARELVDFASAHNHVTGFMSEFRKRQETLALTSASATGGGAEEVARDLVVQFARRMFEMCAEASPMIDKIGNQIGDRTAAVLDDPRFRGQLVKAD